MAAENADILAVTAVVVPPTVVRAIGEPRLRPLAIDFVEHNLALAPGAGDHPAAALAEHPAYHTGLVLTETIITNGAPLAAVADLQPAGVNEADGALRIAAIAPQRRRILHVVRYTLSRMEVHKPC